MLDPYPYSYPDSMNPDPQLWKNKNIMFADGLKKFWIASVWDI